ncbi:MAG: hypothetical protein ACO3FQ_04975 [Terrimicrobiaceae bacterium]
METKPKRRNGRSVAIGLILICLAAFLATVWNYTRTHPFANKATLVSPSQVEAVFSGKSNLQKGQRAVVSISANETKGAMIVDISETGRALIEMDSKVSAPVGTPVHVNIDGTLAPQHPK